MSAVRTQQHPEWMRSPVFKAMFMTFWCGGVCFFNVLILSRPIAAIASHWTYEPVPGSVVSSSDGSGTNSYSSAGLAGVTYTYSVAGQTYTGNRVGFDVFIPGPPETESYVAAYPAGAPITVYVKKSDPTRAVLDRSTGEMAPSMFVALLPFNMVLFSIVTFCVDWVIRRIFIGQDHEALRLVVADRPEELAVRFVYRHPVMQAFSVAMLGAIGGFPVVMVGLFRQQPLTWRGFVIVLGITCGLALVGTVWAIWSNLTPRSRIRVDRLARRVFIGTQDFGPVDDIERVWLRPADMGNHRKSAVVISGEDDRLIYSRQYQWDDREPRRVVEVLNKHMFRSQPPNHPTRGPGRPD